MKKIPEQRPWLFTDVGGVRVTFKVLMPGWKGACCPSWPQGVRMGELPGPKEVPATVQFWESKETGSSFVKPDPVSHGKKLL